MSLNNKFIEQLTHVIPSNEIEGFISSIDNPTRTFVRKNVYKESPFQFIGKSVEWCEQGVALDNRELFTIDPHFHAGSYYVQEASSMFIEQLFVREILPNTDDSIKVLDLCAAPGGKSTHISSLIGADNLLVANEVIRSRASILKENIIKWGAGNTVVTNNDPSHFSSLTSLFDVVLVDAPCSGEGMFRKNEKARSEWSEANVQLCVKRTTRILWDVWSALKTDGYLIYSTCTFNRSENEDMVKWIADELGADIILPDITDYPTIIQSECGYRFHPNRVDSEGFFVALLRKSDSSTRKEFKPKNGGLVKDKKSDLTPWITEPDKFVAVIDNNNLYAVRGEWFNSVSAIKSQLNVLYFETEIGELFGKKLKPSHALALSQYLNKEKNSINNLTNEAVLNYLRRSTVEVGELKEGYNVIGYEGSAVGWAKRVGNRVNNLYPKESRILNY